MRIIKPAIIGIVVFFLVLTGITMLIPADQRISRAINIGAPKDRVAAMIADPRHWASWNKLSGDQLRVSVASASPDSILLDWVQADGKTFRGGFQLLQLRPDSLTVQWWFDFHLRWVPWEKIGSLVYDKQLGPPMEESLQTLKRLMENSP